MPMRAVLATTLLLTLTACGQTTSGTPAAEQTGAADDTAGAACTAVDAPLLDIETKSGTEPRVRIPQPPGWERYTDMDSKMIRAALVNKSLTADGFTPNVVYTLDEVSGEVDPRTALDSERENLVKVGGADIQDVTDTSVCGLVGQTVHYLLAAPGMTAPQPVILREAVMHSGGNTYVVSLSVQTKHPEDPTYQRDSATILDGLQVLAPQG